MGYFQQNMVYIIGLIFHATCRKGSWCGVGRGGGVQMNGHLGGPDGGSQNVSFGKNDNKCEVNRK